MIHNGKNMGFSYDELNETSLESFFEIMLMEIESYPDTSKDNQNKIKKADQSDIDKFLA